MGGARTAFALGVAVALAAGPVAASMNYPSKIQSDLGLTCGPSFPQCTICHENNNGGTGTVDRRFGESMRLNFGLTGGENDGSLLNALMSAQALGFDSDGDGDGDINALKACRDPNVPFGSAEVDGGDGGSGTLSSSLPIDPVPQYGCAFVRLPRKCGGVAAGAAGVTFGLSLWLRRRQRRP